MKNILYLIIPCYNEEEVLPYTFKELNKEMDYLLKNNTISKESKVVFIDDGSKDKTWELIKKESKNNNLFKGIKLSRNRGHQNALLAGLNYSLNKSNIVISMDADLQDDINAIEKMIQEYNNGSEIVYGVRNSRKKDTWFKRNTAQLYYKIMKKLGVDLVYNHADYRLLSERALKFLLEFKEANLFLRGIIPQIGLKSSIVYYEREERKTGISKYPLKNC